MHRLHEGAHICCCLTEILVFHFCGHVNEQLKNKPCGSHTGAVALHLEILHLAYFFYISNYLLVVFVIILVFK